MGPSSVSLLISLVSISLSIVAIELTLAWNNISGINPIETAGQIIPLSVGVTLVSTVLYTTYNQVFNRGGGLGRGQLREALASNAESPRSLLEKVKTHLRRLLIALCRPSITFRPQDRGRRGVRARCRPQQNRSGVEMKTIMENTPGRRPVRAGTF
jgi:hypothetical protein